MYGRKVKMHIIVQPRLGDIYNKGAKKMDLLSIIIVTNNLKHGFIYTSAHVNKPYFIYF